MLDRDERRRRAIAGLREFLAMPSFGEYPRRLAYALEMTIDACESTTARSQSTAYDEGTVMQADEIIYSLYGYLIGKLPDEWYKDEVSTQV